MKKEIPKQREKSKWEKVLSLIGMVIAVVVFVLAFLDGIGIWNEAIYIFEPLLGILMVIQTIEYWKYNKTIAACSLLAAIVVFALSIVTFFF